jgi:hypothetical protein
MDDDIQTSHAILQSILFKNNNVLRLILLPKGLLLKTLLKGFFSRDGNG